MIEEDPSSNLNGVIARSRSRYKGNRSNQKVVGLQTPPKPQPNPLKEETEAIQDEQKGREVEVISEVCSKRSQPPVISSGSAEYKYNYGSTTSNSNHVGAAQIFIPSNGTRHITQENTIQSQVLEPGPSRRKESSEMKAGQHATQAHTRPSYNDQRNLSQKEGIITRHPNAEKKGISEEYETHAGAIQNLERSRADDHHGRSAVASLSPPQKSSKSYEIEEKILPRSSEDQNRQSPKKPSTLQKRSLTHRKKGSSSRDELKRSISVPMPVEPAEVTVKPAFDAPISAVNAGERRVRVQLDQNILSVAVTPSTTPIDIIREARSQLSTPIDSSTHVLVECFKQLGLERPLRKYERVREVMNSWGNDSENSFNIALSPTGGRDDELDLKSVTASQPGDLSVHIYHSNAPGSWDKRWITLRSDGQVLVMKKDGKGSVNICHLSDFDIYVPNKRQLTKKIKPPKKYCFAVKSQQKSSMFLTTENFVHFFAAGDRELAMQWYKAVQGWRSWYLVNIMGEGQTATVTSATPQRALNRSQSNVDQPNPRALPAFYSQSPPSDNHGATLVSSPSKLSKDATSGTATTRKASINRSSIIQHQPKTSADLEPFAAQSLLGRSYTQRQKAAEREQRENADGFVYPSPMVGSKPTSSRDGLQRRSSQRPKQQPLIDLTPTYQEPPQHRKKGTGIVPDHFPEGGLIEAATNVDPTVTNPLEMQGGDTWKPSTMSSQYCNSRQRKASAGKDGPAFTGGLLSLAQNQGQAGVGTGRGVRTGERSAKEPLIDMTVTGPWAKGSLLDKVNSADSGSSPHREREREKEMNDTR